MRNFPVTTMPLTAHDEYLSELRDVDRRTREVARESNPAEEDGAMVLCNHMKVLSQENCR